MRAGYVLGLAGLVSGAACAQIIGYEDARPGWTGGTGGSGGHTGASSTASTASSSTSSTSPTRRAALAVIASVHVRCRRWHGRVRRRVRGLADGQAQLRAVRARLPARGLLVRHVPSVDHLPKRDRDGAQCGREVRQVIDPANQMDADGKYVVWLDSPVRVTRSSRYWRDGGTVACCGSDRSVRRAWRPGPCNHGVTQERPLRPRRRAWAPPTTCTRCRRARPSRPHERAFPVALRDRHSR